MILNVSSISRAGNIGQTNYSAAKSGVDAMTVTWAKELSHHLAAWIETWVNVEALHP